MTTIEIVPAILRTSFERIQADWNDVIEDVPYVQIDITDGVFAGDGSFRDFDRLATLGDANKMEFHLMVQPPGDFVDALLNLKPGKVVFHVEAFTSDRDVEFTYTKLREIPRVQLGLAVNPTTSVERLKNLVTLIDYVLFLGVHPGHAGQPVEPSVYVSIQSFAKLHPDIPIAVDGHVGKDTIEEYVQAGARILCINSGIFKEGNPKENIRQLRLLAEAALETSSS